MSTPCMCQLQASSSMNIPDDYPSDSDENDTIEIRVYELHWFGKRRERVGSVSFKAYEMLNAQPNIFGEKGHIC